MTHAKALALSYWNGMCRYGLKHDILKAFGYESWRRGNIKHYQMSDGSRLVVRYVPGKRLMICPLEQTETFHEELLR